MHLYGSESSITTITLWTIIFAILVALWAQEDAESGHKEIPFEYSFLVFLLWPPMLAYYLIKSHGFLGCLIFLGFLFLYLMPFAIGLTINLGHYIGE